MLSITQLASLRATANQILARAWDPERFLTLYGIRVQQNQNFQQPGEYRDAALANGWDKVLEVYMNFKAEAPEGLNLLGMRQYFNQIAKGKSREDFDIWLVNGLNASRTDNEAYKRFIEVNEYQPITEAGKARLAAIKQAIKDAEADKGKSGWFGDMAVATGAAPGAEAKPAAEGSDISQQIQALSIQLQLNHDELLAKLKDLETKY